MKSILITGVAGMLGANVAYTLRHKHHICGIDIFPFEMKDVSFTLLSATEIDQVSRLITENHIDVMIHCAAIVNVDECEEDPERAQEINLQLTKDLSDCCKKADVKMIFISTDAVYPGTKDSLYEENDKTGPLSVYGKTKLAAEAAVLENERNLVMRTNIYGYNYRNKHSFGEWVYKSLLEGYPLNMFYDIWFSPILVNDLAEIMDLCIQKNICGLYNICATGSISKYDIAVAIHDSFSLPGIVNRTSMKTFDFKAPRTQNMGMDNSRIKKELAINIRTPLESVSEFKRLFDIGYPEKLKSGDEI